MSSILVLNEVRGLGNLVLLSGLVHNLRRLYPEATVAVAMPSSPLVHAVIGPDLVDEFLFFDPAQGRRALLRFAWHVLRPRRFDLGLATFFSPTLLTSCVLALGGCRYRVAYAEGTHRGFLNTVTLLDSGGHELDRHLQLLKFTGRQLERRTVVSVPVECIEEARRFLASHRLGTERPVLGIHPGCDRVNALKRWPVDRFVAVINQVLASGLADVLVFLGPDDMDLQPTLAETLNPRVPIVCSEGLQSVMALIAACHTFLSNDSGLMHVAAASGVPVVSIFGPTDTVKNAPVGRAAMLTAAGVPCRPCYAGVSITCIHERRYCLDGISESEVLRAVTRMLTFGAEAQSQRQEGMEMGCASDAA